MTMTNKNHKISRFISITISVPTLILTWFIFYLTFHHTYNNTEDILIIQENWLLFLSN